MTKDYQNSIVVPMAAREAMELVTDRIDEWWSTDFEGQSKSVGDTFTVRFNTTFKTMHVLRVEQERLVEWQCIDQNIDMPEGMKPLQNKREWVGNIIRWEVAPEAEGKSLLTLTHFGLTPDVECWAVCEPGWNQTMASIQALGTTGSGRPFARLDDEHLEKAKKIYNERS